MPYIRANFIPSKNPLKSITSYKVLFPNKDTIKELGVINGYYVLKTRG
jgi:hypothetical protein